MSFKDFLSEKIARRGYEGLLRKLKSSTALADFSSNDYLGLARSQELYNRIQRAMEALPFKYNGATGSRLLTGNSSYAEALEAKLATIFKGEAALLFNSGYAANQAVLSAIPQKSDTVLYDELSHACIKDGIRLSLAAHHPFRHNDPHDLEKKIKRSKPGRLFIVAESIYSMDGDVSPLPEIVQLAEKYNAVVIVDEAHSTGILGDRGCGLTCLLNLHDRIDVRIYTFGKALGVHGACVVGSAKLIEYLINFARPFIYTTALPPHDLVSISCAFDYLGENMLLQNLLSEKIQLFLSQLTFTNRTPSQSAIQTALFPGHENVKRMADILQQKGFDVRPILSPAVPKNTERLRICLHTFNSDEDIRRLAETLNHAKS